MEKWLKFMGLNFPVRLIVILNAISIVAFLVMFSVVWAVTEACK